MVARIEVEVVGVIGITFVGRTAPIVAVRTMVVEGRPVAITGSRPLSEQSSILKDAEGMADEGADPASDSFLFTTPQGIMVRLLIFYIEFTSHSAGNLGRRHSGYSESLDGPSLCLFLSFFSHADICLDIPAVCSLNTAYSRSLMWRISHNSRV